MALLKRGDRVRAFHVSLLDDLRRVLDTRPLAQSCNQTSAKHRSLTNRKSHEIHHITPANPVLTTGNQHGTPILTWLYHHTNEIEPDKSKPLALVAGTATRREAKHINTPKSWVRLTAFRGTKGRASFRPSAFDIAIFWIWGVGEKGSRAWPPRRSSKERMEARM